MHSTSDVEAKRYDALTRFTVPVRPLSVPPDLLALEPTHEVWCDVGAAWAMQRSGVVTAADAVQAFERTIERQRRGHFHPDEAAHVLAEAQGFEPSGFRKLLERAFRAGELRVRAPDTEVPREPSEAWRPATDLLTIEDLDRWLAATGVSYRFPRVDSPPRDRATNAATGEPRARRHSVSEAPKGETSAPAKAAGVRWEHLQQTKARAVELAKSAPCKSRSEAVSNIYGTLVRPKPKHNPNADARPYSVETIDGWLKEAGWGGGMSWDEWVALQDAVDRSSAS